MACGKEEKSYGSCRRRKNLWLLQQEKAAMVKAQPVNTEKAHIILCADSVQHSALCLKVLLPVLKGTIYTREKDDKKWGRSRLTGVSPKQREKEIRSTDDVGSLQPIYIISRQESNTRFLVCTACV